MYDRQSVTEKYVEVDMTKLIDGPVDYLLEGLKEYTNSQLNEIENYARSNIKLQSGTVYVKGAGWSENKEQQYLMKLGTHNYLPTTVIDAIAKERERRNG